MTGFTDADGDPLPDQTTRIVHRHSDRSARDARIECTVLEIEHAITPTIGVAMGMPRLRMLVASASDETWRFVASEFLAAIVTKRVNEGWSIISLTDTSASLQQ